ncbi:hypothetical protein INS49_001747 [Diaporthe citri]|uniref:uncharacterized protein n=1 Tax=Diaporthe citri TaxID=83186 RepID=UPI001C82017A|nr:uncharacterized protein INS49_001747 [Diaporthe citri]KAG6367554.1 hypothetical protein INS49_001747 [Diaporthe citri]
MGRPSTNASSTSRNSTSLKSPLTATSSSNRTYPHSSIVDDGDLPLSNDIWSRSDSDDSNDDAEAVPAASERSNPRGSGSRTTGFFRSLMHRISKSYKRYGFIPNNQQEQDRNVLQHEIIKELFDGRFHLAPARRPKTVLDIGTGPGLWALQNPRSSVLGIDLEPVKPPYLVSNCHFQIRDATEDWDLNTTFDLVHARMLGDLPEKERLVQAVWDNLNPGGWAEFTEWIVLLQSPNHSFENTSFHKWNKLMSRGKFMPQAIISFANSDFTGLKDLGSSLYYPTQYKPLLEKVGFENITVTKYGAPTNACYPGKKLQKIGTMMAKNWNAIIEPLTLSVFIDGLGWSADDVKKFVLNVKREIPDTRYHSFMTLMTVYCRKPRVGSASTSVSSFQSTPVPEHATRRSNDQLTHIAEGQEPPSA